MILVKGTPAIFWSFLFCYKRNRDDWTGGKFLMAIFAAFELPTLN
jgi:hypothetical protein